MAAAKPDLSRASLVLALSASGLVAVAPRILAIEGAPYYFTQGGISAALFLAGYIAPNFLPRTYRAILWAFGLLSLASLLSMLADPIVAALGWSDNTKMDITAGTVMNRLVIIVPIVVLALISGRTRASLYMQSGSWKWGIFVGSAGFLVFTVMAIPVAAGLLEAADVTPADLLRWSPWIIPIVLANAFEEELRFRGLLLRPLGGLVGTTTAVWVQAFIFSMAHLEVTYTPTLIAVATTFFLGLLWGYTMQKTRSMIGSVLFHAGADVTVIAMIFSTL